MSRRTFPCGHSGKGQYCHRCAAEQQERQKKDSERQARAQAQAEREARLGLNLTGIPQHVVRDLERVAEMLRTHQLPSGSQRMNFDRTCISVPLAGEYRLLIKDMKGGFQLRNVVSHEEYNNLVRNRAIKGW